MIRIAATRIRATTVTNVLTSTCRNGRQNKNSLLQSAKLKRFKSVVSSTSSNEDMSSSSSSSSSSSQHGLYRLLTSDERKLLAEQRQLTAASRQLASQVGFATDLFQSTSFLEEFQLESTFAVVVAGEFNAGKSTLINALLGTKLLESGAVPTTDSITIIAKKDEDEEEIKEEISPATSSSQTSSSPMGVTFHSLPHVPLLEDLTLVDTPGTNAVWMDHTVTTLRLLPAADLILFVTSADRPFPDSERTLLRSIQEYRKNIVVIVNKIDILDSSGGDHGIEQKKQVVDFVTENASELLGARPVVIPISSRDALSTRVMNRRTTMEEDGGYQQLSNVWHRSNFQSLESFLKNSLTAETKLKSKLSSPIGIVDSVMAGSLKLLKDQRKELEADVATLNILQSQFLGWKKEMSADLTRARMEMTEVVNREGQRFDVLMDRMKFHQLYLWTLTDMAKLENEWDGTQSNVTRLRSDGIEGELLEQVKETADSVATRGRAQGQAVIEYLGKRPAVQNQSLVGSVTAASRFEDTRQALTEQLTQAVQSSLKTDEDVVSTEREEIIKLLRQTALTSAALHAGAVTSALSMVAQLLDPMTGLAATSSLAMGGGILHMVGTSRIRNEYQGAWTRRVQMLDDALKAICEKELDRVNRRILDGVAPYTRFVEREQERIDDLREQCEGVSSAARNLRNRINKIN